jgi:hypothetical protein
MYRNVIKVQKNNWATCSRKSAGRPQTLRFKYIVKKALTSTPGGSEPVHQMILKQYTR